MNYTLTPLFENISAIDPVLRSAGKLRTNSSSSNYERAVVNSLHQLSSDPETLVKIVDAVDNIGGFNRTDINMAVKEIVNIAK